MINKRGGGDNLRQTCDFLNQIPKIFIFSDLSGKIFFWNNYAAEIFQWNAKEVIGRVPWDFIVHANEQELCEEIITILTRKGLWKGEVEMCRKDNTTFPVTLEISFASDNDSGKDFIVCVGSDITNLKDTENTLRENNKHYSELVNNLPQAVFESDSDGHITYTNFCGLSRFGYTKDDILDGVHFSDLVVQEDTSRARINIERTLKGKAPRSDEYTARHKDGTTFPIAVYTTPIASNGASSGCRAVVVDVTEQKNIEESLRISEREKEAILNCLQDVIIIHIGRNMQVLWANSATSRLLKSPRNVCGSYCYEVMFDRTEPCPECTLAKAALTGKINEGEMKLADGRFWHIRSYPVKEEGQVIGIIHMAMDVAERKNPDILKKSYP